MMNVTAAQSTLKDLRAAPSSSSSRVAARWVEANMAAEYDKLIRLQILEGVAGVPVDTWLRQGGLRGLDRAKKVLMDKFPDNKINPEWFDPTATSTYKTLMAQTARAIASFRVRDMDPHDFINSALMGIATDPLDKERLRPGYQLGHQRAKAVILDGTDTPQAVAAGGLSKALFNRVHDYANSKKREVSMPVDDEDNPIEFADKSEGTSALDFLAYLFFDQHGDALVNKVQDLMAKTWEGSSPMTHWLNYVLLTGDFPSMNEIAETSGISAQSFGQNHWRPRWNQFIKALWGDTSLRQEILTRMRREGIDTDPIEDYDDLVLTTERVRNRATKTASPIVHKVATAFLLRAIMEDFPDTLFRSVYP